MQGTENSRLWPILPRLRAVSAMRRIAGGRLAAMFLVLALLAIYFHVATHGIFFSPRNLSLLFRQGSIAAIVASGVSILIIMGEIDLSIGSAVYLCSVIAASLQANLGVATLPTVMITVLAGSADGCVAGILGGDGRRSVLRRDPVRAARVSRHRILRERCAHHRSRLQILQLPQRGFHPADRVLRRFARPLRDRGGGADLDAARGLREEDTTKLFVRLAILVVSGLCSRGSSAVILASRLRCSGSRRLGSF